VDSRLKFCVLSMWDPLVGRPLPILRSFFITLVRWQVGTSVDARRIALLNPNTGTCQCSGRDVMRDNPRYLSSRTGAH
jgi:hypothetical protein